MACGEPVERSHRFCPWCAAPLRSKLVEFFAPHPHIEGEAYGLRVSRYLGGEPSTQHTRFSIWGRDSALAAVSLDTAETQRLVRYLGERGRDPDESPTEQMPAVSG